MLSRLRRSRPKRLAPLAKRSTCSKSRPKGTKSSLPVDERRSKTSLLKLPQISCPWPEVHWLQCRTFLHIYKEEVFSSNSVNINTLYFVFQCWKRDLITHYERDTWKATTGQRLLPTCLTGRHVMWRGLSLKIAWKVTRMLLKIWSSLDFEFTAVKINLISKLK